jgi:hypothetical protein
MRSAPTVVRVPRVCVESNLNVQVLRVHRVRRDRLDAPVVELRVVRPVEERRPGHAVGGELVRATDVGAQVGKSLSIAFSIPGSARHEEVARRPARMDILAKQIKEVQTF